MPTYVYRCLQCNVIEDHYRRIDDRDDSPIHHGQSMKRLITPIMITPEIADYKTVAADKETGKPVHIGSRRQHREFLKRNDYIEVGNDPIRKPRNDGPADAPVFNAEELRKRGWIEDVL